MYDAAKEARNVRHDVACELQALQKDMERIQKALFDVGLASLGTTVGGWSKRVGRAQTWIWPKGDPMDEK
jgi:cob(I)alamin adenosyltransferase